MDEEQIQSLLTDLKNYLDITWDDARTDQKLMGMVKRGMAAISEKIGECDFLEETSEKALLFDYVMYARAGEIPQFWKHYQSELVSLQISRKVERYAEKESEPFRDFHRRPADHL